MRLTVAQALVRFLAAQVLERDGRRDRFFAGCFGIFGHGNVAGLGQALQQHADLLPYHPARNEQDADGARFVSPDGSDVAVLVVPTDEEWEIARQSLAVVNTHLNAG